MPPAHSSVINPPGALPDDPKSLFDFSCSFSIVSSRAFIRCCEDIYVCPSPRSVLRFFDMDRSFRRNFPYRPFDTSIEEISVVKLVLKSCALQILRTLEKRAYVVRDPTTNHFLLDIRAFEIGSACAGLGVDVREEVIEKYLFS